MNERDFWKNYEQVGECWIWTRGRHPFGYGAANINGKGMGAHRVAWMLTRGAIPPGLMVCHRCDTPECIRPSHLFVGTAADNNRDMARKGRASGWPTTATKRGEANNNARLTANQVRTIRTLYRSGMGLGSVARAMGCAKRTVHLIVTGKTWAHLPDKPKPKQGDLL